MSGIDVLRLRDDGSYQITKASIEPGWPGLLRAVKIRQLYSLKQDPVFPRAAPLEVETWDQVLAHEPRPRLNSSSAVLLVNENEFWPVTDAELPRAEQKKEYKRLNEVRTQRAKPESTEGGRRVSVLKQQEGAPVLLG